ncbi:MAG: DUF4426 domain-containing protein [Lysobacter sp.]|nr:DUF4426 domain-containing protein [Lysobacter sp.]MDQ3269057.1 DUF4426 domain-containing protein [Pseudomonadota bacterium]
MLLPALLWLTTLAACGGGSSPPRTASAAPPEAITRSGDVTIRASAVPTSMLGEVVARRYGIRSSEETILLLVALRRGKDANETSVPAKVGVTVTDLSGQRQDVPMRELRSGDLLDYVGTVDISGPDTLRFVVRTVRENGEVSTLQFAREFHPL